MIKRERMIFKDIENCILGTKKEIEIESSVEAPNIKYLRKKAQQLAALEKVGEYIDSNEWLTREDAKQRINTIRALRYDYREAEDVLGMTYDAIRTFMRYCNGVAKEKVGESTIDLIMEGEIKVSMVQFETLRGTYGVEKLINGEVLKELPRAEFKPTTILQCKEEIEFLYDMSKSTINARLSKLNIEKLQFIMYVMTKSTPKYAQDKYDLIGLLLGKGMGVEEYFENLERETAFTLTELRGEEE